MRRHSFERAPSASCIAVKTWTLGSFVTSSASVQLKHRRPQLSLSLRNPEIGRSPKRA